MALVPGFKKADVKPLVIHDNVLHTDGALESMRIPEGWEGSIIEDSEYYMRTKALRFISADRRAAVNLSLKYYRLFEAVVDILPDCRKLFESDMHLTGPEEPQSRSGEVSPLQRALWDLDSKIGVEECLEIRTTTFKGMRAAIVNTSTTQGASTFKAMHYFIDVLGDLNDARLKEIDGIDTFAPTVYHLQLSTKAAAYEEFVPTALAIFESSVWRSHFDRLKLINVY